MSPLVLKQGIMGKLKLADNPLPFVGEPAEAVAVVLPSQYYEL